MSIFYFRKFWYYFSEYWVYIECTPLVWNRVVWRHNTPMETTPLGTIFELFTITTVVTSIWRPTAATTSTIKIPQSTNNHNNNNPNPTHEITTIIWCWIKTNSGHCFVWIMNQIPFLWSDLDIIIRLCSKYLIHHYCHTAIPK